MAYLKPCPFCGGTAVKIIYWDEEEQNEKAWEHGAKQDEQHYLCVRCYDCDIQFFGGVPINGYELIEAWNKRTQADKKEGAKKHGRWFHINNDGIIYCSECNNEAYWDTDYGQQLFDYCPYCGAKMIKDGDTE